MIVISVKQGRGNVRGCGSGSRSAGGWTKEGWEEKRWPISYEIQLAHLLNKCKQGKNVLYKHAQCVPPHSAVLARLEGTMTERACGLADFGRAREKRQDLGL